MLFLVIFVMISETAFALTNGLSGYLFVLATLAALVIVPVASAYGYATIKIWVNKFNRKKELA